MQDSEIGNTRISNRWMSWLESYAFSDSEQWAEWMRTYVKEADAGHILTTKLALTEPDSDEHRRTLTAAQQSGYSSGLNETVNIHCTPSTAINALLYYLGLETFSYLWADHLDLLKQWIRIYRQQTLNYIEIAANAESSPMAMIYSDIAYNNGPMFSMKMFREMGFFDEIAGICEACHGKNMKVIFHSDGNIMSLLEDLVSTGIDGLNPIEKAAGMDIFTIRRSYPELTIVGGVDVTHLLRIASPGEIRKEARKIINEAGSEGRLLIGSSTEVGNDIPLESYLAFHNEVMTAYYQ